MKICKNYINGEWVESVSGKTAPTYNPANGEILAEVVQSGLEDVERAVAAAKTSFYETRDWRDMDSQTSSTRTGTNWPALNPWTWASPCGRPKAM